MNFLQNRITWFIGAMLVITVFSGCGDDSLSNWFSSDEESALSEDLQKFNEDTNKKYSDTFTEEDKMKILMDKIFFDNAGNMVLLTESEDDQIYRVTLSVEKNKPKSPPRLLGAMPHYGGVDGRDISTLQNFLAEKEFGAKKLATASESEIDIQYLKYDLSKGIRHTDILIVQTILNSSGFTVANKGIGSPGNEGDYYGDQTSIALKGFKANRRVEIQKFGPYIDSGEIVDFATRQYMNTLISEDTSLQSLALGN
jgi:hypothetical protein